MIVEVQTTLEKPELPRDYRPALVSLIKAALQRTYPERYAALYESGPLQKSFTFAVGLPEPRFAADRVLLGGARLQLTISSADEEDVLLFYNAFRRCKGFRHPLPGGNALLVGEVRAAPTAVLTERPTVIRFLSPLVVRRHTKGEPDRYFVSSDEAFFDCLSAVVARQLANPEHSVTLTPLRAKKTVVTAFGVQIRCSLGTFLLGGSAADKNALLRGGIGSRRSEGFGLFTVDGRA